MSRKKITVILPCKNEEKNIRECLESVKWADEIMVVDSGSTDNTLAIVREYTDRILVHEYVNSAAQKNWAIPQAAHEWVMVIDADERATNELQHEIQTLLASEPSEDGYVIYRKNWFFGKPIRYCGWDSDKVLRLWKRDLGRYQDRHVHANVEISTGRIGILKNVLEHHTYRSFDQYFEKFGRYTTWGALDRKKRGRHATFFSLMIRPIARFLRQYILQRGFLDGKAGLILCGMSAFTVFTRYAKLWAIERAEAGEKGVESGRKEW